MISKGDIEFGKLVVQNGFINSEQLEESIDELRKLYLTDGYAPSLADYLVQKKYLDRRTASSLVLANKRLSRDREKDEFQIKGYELIRKIGQGGLGVVFKARQITMNRLVALKILHKRWITDEEFRKRFLVEARIVGKLSHQNLIKVFDVGKEEWKYYFSMEFIDGETVEDKIDRDGRMDPMEAVDITIQILRALKYISSHNIVHCDIKPGNILVTRDSIAKLGDFGFVKTSIEIEPAEEGTVLGTPDYISPEQAMGKEVDHRSDIYSLGASLYHMLTGAPPYQGSVSTVMEKHIRSSPPSIREVASDLPDYICQIVEKMMAKQKNQRYQKFEDIFEDIEAAKINLAGGGNIDELQTRSKSTLYNVIRFEKNKAMKHLASTLELEQQLSRYRTLLWISLGYIIISLGVIVFLLMD